LRQSVSRIEWLALGAILALAALLRFGWVGVNSFAFDEARLSLISLRMARGGEFATLGMPSSAGVPNFPGAAWIFALPYALSTDPLIATWFVGLLSLLCVIGGWWLARRAWGAWAGLLAALYLAASPYAVLYARSIWAQNLLVPLALAWLGTAYLALAERKRWALTLHVFLAGFAVQVHFAGASLALGTLYLFLRFRWWRQIVPVLIGGGLALLAFVPTLVTLANNAEVADGFRAAFGNPAQIDLTAFEALARLALGKEWQYLAAGDTQGSSEAWTAVVGVVLLVSMLALLRRGFKTLGYPKAKSLKGLKTEAQERQGASQPIFLDTVQRDTDSAGIVSELSLVSLIAPLVFFLRHSTPVFLHYMLVALPALALLAGASVGLHPSRIVKGVMTAALLIAAVLWSAGIARSLDLAGREERPNGLGTPLGLLRDAAYSVRGDAPVLLFTHGDDPNVDGEAAAFEALWWGRPHRIVQGESVLILPRSPATLMAALAPFQAWEELEAAGLAEKVVEFPRRMGAQPFVVTFYDGRLPSGFIPVEPPVLLADGAQLEGWRWRWVGPRLRVSTLWRVIEPLTSGTYQQFHHLRSDEMVDGEPLQGADVPLSAHRWQEGDLVIVMGDFFDVTPGEYVVDVGHYTLPDVARIPRADGGEGAVRLGPFVVQ
jgi:4-amino-4-deoxy-L-arabinose transferase-like glycosyltransferase